MLTNTKQLRLITMMIIFIQKTIPISAIADTPEIMINILVTPIHLLKSIPVSTISKTRISIHKVRRGPDTTNNTTTKTIRTNSSIIPGSTFRRKSYNTARINRLQQRLGNKIRKRIIISFHKLQTHAHRTMNTNSK
ncbi:Cap [Circular ssDNA virus sp.]|nr:Cap [Circular ssDNA virus sp.]